MSIIITGMEMPTERESFNLTIKYNGTVLDTETGMQIAEAHELPPHGDLIDRDALIKDGWLNLHKEVMRMGGYAIHELPLKNPLIPVIIPAEEGET